MRIGLVSGGLVWMLWVSVRLAAVSQPEPVEVRFFPGSGGRFEIAALDGEAGERLERLAEEAWDVWRGPLGLPERFATGITVRLTPPEQWAFPEPAWRVAAEPTGLVSLWIRGGGVPGVERERRWAAGLAAAVLKRVAILQGVGSGERMAPDWLCAAAAEAVLVERQPAMADAWRQAAARPGGAAGLEAILKWRGAQTADGTSPSWVGAFGLWRWLGAGPGRTEPWPRFVAGLLAGEAPGVALTRIYGSALARPEKAELELAWRTALAALARELATPILGAEETRRLLEWLARLVVKPAGAESEQVLELGALTSLEAEGFPASERDARAAWLAANLPRLHPFYRNAGGSLGRCWLAQREGEEKVREAALADWRADLAAGLVLERGSRAALDGN